MINLFDQYSKSELLITDIQFLDLKKQAWEFSRGARTQRIYLYDNDAVAVKDYYTYTYDANNRSVTGLQRHIEWYDGSQVLKVQKTINQEINTKDLNALNREIRQGRIDYLEAAASSLAQYADLVPEPYKTDFKEAGDSVDILFSYYSQEIDQYIKRNSTVFEDKVQTETNPIIVKILSLNSYIPDQTFPNGLTIKQAIMYQLNGTVP